MPSGRVVENRAEPARRNGEHACVARRAGPTAQLHAGDAVALTMHSDNGLAEMDSVEPGRRGLREPNERNAQIRDPGGVTASEKGRADDEEPHLRGDAVERCIQCRYEERIPEGTHCTAALMMATQPRGHVALRGPLSARGEQRTTDLDAIERCQKRIARETSHQVERGRQ